MRKTQGHRKARWRLETHVVSRHHACGDVDREGDPRPADGFTLEAVDKDDVGRCVIDLHDVQRPLCRVLPCHRRETLPCRLRPLARFHDFAHIHRIESALNCPARRPLKPLLTASTADFADHPRQAGTLPAQVVSHEVIFDDGFDLVGHHGGSRWTATFLRNNRTGSAASFGKPPDPPPDCRSAYPQLPNSVTDPALQAAGPGKIDLNQGPQDRRPALFLCAEPPDFFAISLQPH